MKKISALILILCSFFTSAQVTINITSVPLNTPPDDDLYIAGTFNSWDPGSPTYKLTEINAGFFTITLASGNGTIEFKFTRGDWAKVECKSDGSFQPNRTFTYGNSDTLNLVVEGWDDLVNGGVASTALSNVVLMDDSFYMPQLNRYRKIWTYLPDDYDTAINKFYPVMYMQDGQNLFDDSTSFAGEWEVDEALHSLQMDGNYGCIVIGIENGGSNRLNEYSPYYNPSYGGGEGDEYCDFMVTTLKPYIDSHFRTLSSREFTAVAGSSMGGLISFYAAMNYQDVFSKAGVFSPSFWFDDSIYIHVSTQGAQQDMRFYFVAGRYESSDMVPDIQSMYATMSSAGFTPDEMDTVIMTDGQHAEWFWAREFPDCYKWLFSNTIAHAELPADDSVFFITPNPAQDKIFLHSEFPMKKIRVEIFNSEGKKVFSSQQHFSKSINIDSLKNGYYFLKVEDGKNSYAKIFAVTK
ncbi:MAG: alpha/beta hydrolase-fold protein [Chitinophagales bacterium]